MLDDSKGRVPHLADATDIVQWSTRVESRTEFPRLIRRLIRENNDQVVRLEMRAADGTGLPGLDGIVEANRGTPFVPEGLSYWELGTNTDPRAKANDDYRKRTAELREGAMSDAAFVFVTSRRWPRKSEWEDEKRAEGHWRDVRVFDADDIEQALENAPAVHIWISEIVGKPARGAQSIEDWWDRFASQTNPQLTASLVLAGREDTAAEVLRLLQVDRRYMSLGGKSVDDDLAFLASAILSAGDDLASDLLGKTVIVREEQFLRHLDGGSELLLVVPFEDPLRRVAESVRSHRIVFLGSEDTPADVALPPIGIDSFGQELVRSGVSEDKAISLARAAERSLRKFRRLAAKADAIPVPEWADQLRSKILRRAWLAGGWNSERTGDTDVLSTLFGMEYREVSNELWQAARVADPLFTHVAGIWAVTSQEDSWDYCRGQFNAEDLRSVESVIQTVLGAIDPALELPVEDRWKANIYGKSRVHSSALREGLATTLAFFAARGGTVTLGSGTTGQNWAENIVYRLLDRANDDSTGQLWSSLSDVLPLLAEAAPRAFLEAVRVGVQGSTPVLRTQFIDQGQHDAFSVSSPHTGLLWALESLAWSSELFGLTVELLARLAEIDPGGRLSNRPLGSLVSSFRPWLPQTSASAASRSRTLGALVNRHFGVGWELLLGLLPDRHAWGMHTHAPRFRTWKTHEEGVTHKDYSEFVSAVVGHILAFTKRDPLLWTQIAPRLSDLPPAERANAIAHLQELSREELSHESCVRIWEAMAAVLRQHRSSPDALWVLPAEELDFLETAIEGLEPVSPFERHKWLFDDEFADVGFTKRGDFDAHRAAANQRRENALLEILQFGGLDSLSSLATQVSRPWTLGVALAAVETAIQPSEIVELLDAEDGKLVNFALAYVIDVSQGKPDWLEAMVGRVAGRPVVQARLLAASKDLPSAWSDAHRLGKEVEESYWKEFQTLGRGFDFPQVNEAARKLIEHERPAVALDLLSRYREQVTDPVDPRVVVAGFEALLSREDEDPELRSLSSWEIERLLEFLRGSQIDENELTFLEWRLLPAIGIEGSSPILERRLARDPEFFVEILSLVYKPEAKEPERKVLSTVAQNAFRLLSNWKTIPGSSEPAEPVDEAQLKTWIDDARRLLTEVDRVTVGESHIGQVFSHSPVDEDGTWPALPIRNMIEEFGSISLERGFHMGVVNNRGVTTRGLGEGGDQERKVAKRYEDFGNELADQWPRTAAVLRSLAESYRFEARTHDDDANRFFHGLDRE